ncbi:MAG: M23 family metallopeptidase, partial [Anaerolineae bacterium]|nr:M23 family metallopeptidase [Anaerolineae bacterium]
PVIVPAESFTYTVKPDDTFWTLALDFGRDLDTMACATSPLAADVEALRPGQTITVPALHDLCYTVTPGDTLESIARRHGLSVAEIVAVPWNALQGPPYTIMPRQRILLPGVRPDAQPRPERHKVSIMADDWAFTPYRDWPYGDGQFIWPVVGPISQAAHEGHWALDIAVPEGTPVRAADRGTVIVAGWSPVGYGFRVVIDHGNDYLTLYAHLRDIYVEKGQVVGKGQTIGVSGSNGNITGPHLHFEMRDFGVLIDPRLLLPK